MGFLTYYDSMLATYDNFAKLIDNAIKVQKTDLKPNFFTIILEKFFLMKI